MSEAKEDDGRRLLALVFEEADPAAIASAAEALSDPGHADYGRYWDRETLRAKVALEPNERLEVLAWFEGHGITELDFGAPEGQLVFLEATTAQIRDCFGERAARWLENPRTDNANRIEWGLPRNLAGRVQSVRVLREPGRAREWIEGGRWLADDGLSASPAAACEELPPGLGGFSPADLFEIYDIPTTDDDRPAWTGAGETIAVVLFGATPPVDDLHAFWCAHGIDRPSPHVVNLGPAPPPPSHLETLEAAMALQWAGAMAPEAELVAYVVDQGVVPDPWAAALMAALADDTHRPTILSTSWLIAERSYYAANGSRTIRGLLDQCAVAGISVVSGSGDWGAFDGVPRMKVKGLPVMDSPWPHGVFPAVEPRVLGVGGTMVTHRAPLTEVAWSGPLPPKLKNYPFTRMASGGGFSDEVPIPDFQRDRLVISEERRLRRTYSRGTDAPAVIAYGRGFPDVAVLATGPSVHRPGDEGLSATGYRACVGGHWIDYAGGTSVGAPVWAGLLAQLNQARVAAGKPRLGCVNPLFYALATAHKKSEAAEKPFRDITVGRTDVTVRAVNGEGNPYPHELEGFEAGSDWDPATGLGVPIVKNLLRLLT